ncbi:hypothetical protein, partial [Duganella sp. Root336D2]|uniref:hypothetical protein n=1 Tax=Duganella sp. Root336D2 TaxID=1736518 RepID=UPI001E55ED36
PAEAAASFGLDRSPGNAAADSGGVDLAPTPAQALLNNDLFRPDPLGSMAYRDSRGQAFNRAQRSV